MMKPDLNQASGLPRLQPTSLSKWTPKIGLLLILLVTLIHLRWTLGANHYFYADTWVWLYVAEFRSYGDIFSWLPLQAYNDRPIGAMFIKLEYGLFGLNSTALFAVHLGLHLLNIVLVYAITRRLSRHPVPSLATALLFGNYFPALIAVHWIGAVFDLLGTTLFLGSLLCALSRRVWIMLIGVGLFFFAVRTKEMFITLPLLLIVHDLFFPEDSERRWSILAILRRRWPYWLTFVILGGAYFYRYSQSAWSGDAEAIYHHSFTPGTLWRGLRHYVGVLLYAHSRAPWLGLPENVLTGGLILAVGAAAWAKQKLPVYAFLSFVISLTPVIFLSNQRHDVYLYLPLFFFALCLAGLFWWVGSWFALRENKESPTGIKSWLPVWLPGAAPLILSTGFVVAIWNSNHQRNVVHWYLNNSRIYRKNLDFVRQTIPDPPPHTTFYISGLPNYLNVFNNGSGNSLRVLYHDATLQCEITGSESELRNSYEQNRETARYFLKYENGKLVLEASDPSSRPSATPLIHP